MWSATPSRRRHTYIAGSMLMLLLIAWRCRAYDHEYDIGVNQGISNVWLMIVDMPIYTFAFVPVSVALWFGFGRRSVGMWLLAILLDLAWSWALTDLHRARYPSPISEGSTSVLWSHFMQ